MRAIFSIDPGGHTGVAWGIVDETLYSAVEALRTRIHFGSTTVQGAPIEQARQLFGLWEEFKQQAIVIGRMEVETVDLVVEDFVLRAGGHAGGRDGTAPERVAYAFEGYRHGRFDTYRKQRHLTPISWQSPSSAARYKRRVLLERSNAWVVGKEHERSAYSHILLRINVLMDLNKNKRL